MLLQDWGFAPWMTVSPPMVCWSDVCVVCEEGQGFSDLVI